MTEIEMLWVWALGRAEPLQRRLRNRLGSQDSERGELLVWVVMTALLVAAAIAIVAIIVTKATNTANNTKTQ